MSALDVERLLLFDLAGHVYALPIGGIFEVVEAEQVWGVPTLPTSLAGVMNWHGEALPVVAPRVLVQDGVDAAVPRQGMRDGGTALSARQVLVISDRAGEVPKLGLPVDKVLGLVDASSCPQTGSAAGSSVVAECRSIDGRVLSVLNPCRLVARARSAIDEMAA